ncbi:uncharacterized protein LOC118366972 isoform X2 [Oncorhynchus keta]|uniref:uncharacterized protein LOC118366972 isoform X2 n=1 Tax=Oncorhynchus keta TaxID=8018 RepID=UPI0015F955E6|nr:uncharacterized protein LOC118366972 isoform X2 [Oncorhynchus keta]
MLQQSTSLLPPLCTYKAMVNNHIKGHASVRHREFTIIRRVKTTEERNLPPQHTTEQDTSEAKEENYPPDDKGVARMVNYLMTNTKLPAELPQAVNQQSRDGKISSGFPKHLIPKEARCKECDYVLSDPLLITAKGRILTTTGVVEGISTYRRSCLNCGMIYRYQELEDGVHNFDDHIILSLHLCLMIRNALQEADVLLRDTLEAARWCECQTFKGTVSLPSVIGMDGEDRITTLKELR